MKTFVLGLVVVGRNHEFLFPKSKGRDNSFRTESEARFQAEIDGKQAALYTLKNSAGGSLYH